METYYRDIVLLSLQNTYALPRNQLKFETESKLGCSLFKCCSFIAAAVILEPFSDEKHQDRCNGDQRYGDDGDFDLSLGFLGNQVRLLVRSVIDRFVRRVLKGNSCRHVAEPRNVFQQLGAAFVRLQGRVPAVKHNFKIHIRQSYRQFQVMEAVVQNEREIYKTIILHKPTLL